MVFVYKKQIVQFGVLFLPGDQSHPFVQPSINPLACCIFWAGLLGCMVFPPWNQGPNFGSYKINSYPQIWEVSSFLKGTLSMLTAYLSQ